MVRVFPVSVTCSAWPKVPVCQLAIAPGPASLPCTVNRSVEPIGSGGIGLPAPSVTWVTVNSLVSKGLPVTVCATAGSPT